MSSESECSSKAFTAEFIIIELCARKATKMRIRILGIEEETRCFSRSANCHEQRSNRSKSRLNYHYATNQIQPVQKTAMIAGISTVGERNFYMKKVCQMENSKVYTVENPTSKNQD